MPTATPTKPLRLAINGFGRIGRTVLRAYLSHRQLFDAIESANLEHPELNFEAMIEELNQLIRPLNITAVGRKTRNAGKKQAEEVEEAKLMPVSSASLVMLN